MTLHTLRWKLALACAAAIMVIGPAACDLLFRDDPCCNSRPYFRINGIDVENAAFTGPHSYVWTELPEGEPVSWKTYFMRINFMQTYHASKQRTSGSSLYASSCEEEGFRGTKVGLDTVYVITLRAYNADYSANDTINNIIGACDQSCYSEFDPLTNYIISNQIRIKNSSLYLNLRTSPIAKTGAYQFKLVYVLNNGKVFETTTDEVTLTKY